MTEPEKDIWLIIAAIWNGNATPEEKIIFDKWLNESEENKQFYSSINRVVPAKKQYDKSTKERIYNNIYRAILPKQITRRIHLWRYSTVASIAVILVLGAMLLTKKPSEVKETFVEAQTPFGVKSRIFLPDGTVVYLNAGSFLRYPVRFNNEQRQVALEGEAYFEVFRDSKHPFIVQTNHVNIKVYGTHFNVKTFNDNGLIETTLVEGSVGIFKKTDVDQKFGIKLAPNQQAIYDISSDKIMVKKVEAELSTIWKDGKIYFENETLASISKKLERHFNVNIRITSPKLRNELFYGLFTKQKNIFQLLDVMKIHNNFNYTVKNDTILINRT
jgi:ferric-dicitrate binding protein FerR (iron transport regulator)